MEPLVIVNAIKIITDKISPPNLALESLIIMVNNRLPFVRLSKSSDDFDALLL